MRRALAPIAIATALLAAGCGSDPRDGIDPEQPATREGKRDSFGAQEDRHRPQPADLRRHRPGDGARSGCSSSPGRVVRLEGEQPRGRRRPDATRSSSAPSRACWASPSTRTSPATAASTCTSRTSRATPAWSSARCAAARPPSGASSCSSTSPRRTTTAASSRSAPTAACTWAWATAAARSTRAATRRTSTRCSARSSPPTSTRSGRAALEGRLLRAAQPVALLDRRGRSTRSGSPTSARTASRRSTAPSSSSTSRRRTSAGAAFEGSERTERERSVGGPGELMWPVAAYEHDDGAHCSVTGGVVYRGSRAPGAERPLRLRRLLLRHALVARAEPQRQRRRRAPRAGKGPANHAYRDRRGGRAADRLRGG